MATTTLDDLNEIVPQIDAMPEADIIPIKMPHNYYLQKATLAYNRLMKSRATAVV